MAAKIAPPATLARVQELHDAGNSLRKIAEILEAEGVPPAGPRAKWHHANVKWCLEEIERQAGAGAIWGLSPQIRGRLAAQGEEIEGLMLTAIQRMSASAQQAVQEELVPIRTEAARQVAQVQAELRTIRTEAAREVANVRAMLTRRWPWRLASGAAICLGFSLAAWGHGAWLDRNLESYREQRDQIKAELAAEQQTLDQIQEKTGGVSIVETPQNWFLVWPKGAEPYKAGGGIYEGRWVVILKEK